jgi:hypothetical protein
VADDGGLLALLFGPLWLAFHGAWLAALAGALIELSLGRAASAGSAIAFGLLAGTVAGIWMFGPELRRLELGAGGYTPVGRVAANGVDAAILRLADRGR